MVIPIMSMKIFSLLSFHFLNSDYVYATYVVISMYIGKSVLLDKHTNNEVNKFVPLMFTYRLKKSLDSN